MINSRSLDDLDPIPREVCKAHIEECRLVGVEIIITSTYRDFDSQAALYAIGRDGDLTRKKVTNAKPGKSWHNYKCAWDVVPIVQGKPVWNAKDSAWQDVIIAGEKVGAEAGARWKTFPDLPHFQVRPASGEAKIELAEAQLRFQEYGTIFRA